MGNLLEIWSEVRSKSVLLPLGFFWRVLLFSNLVALLLAFRNERSIKVRRWAWADPWLTRWPREEAEHYSPASVQTGSDTFVGCRCLPQSSWDDLLAVSYGRETGLTGEEVSRVAKERTRLAVLDVVGAYLFAGAKAPCITP